MEPTTVYIIGDSTFAYHTTLGHRTELFRTAPLQHSYDIRAVSGASIGHSNYHKTFYKQLREIPDGSSICIAGGWNDSQHTLLQWLPDTIELIQDKKLNVVGRTSLICELDDQLTELLSDCIGEWTALEAMWSELFDKQFDCPLFDDFVQLSYVSPKTSEWDDHHRLLSQHIIIKIDDIVDAKMSDPTR